MATPLMAAIYALIYEVRGTLDPVLLENTLSATADPRRFHDTASFSDFLAPVPQQGAGLVQAYDAAHAATIVEPSSLSFNDTANFVESLDITIRNFGDDEVEYSMYHMPSVSMYTLEADSIYPMWFPNEIVHAHATLGFSNDKLAIPAGDSRTVDIVATPPPGLKASRLPVYSGYVAVNGSDGSSFSIPYQGIVGSLRKATLLSPRDVWIGKSTDVITQPIPVNTTFTLPLQTPPWRTIHMFYHD